MVNPTRRRFLATAGAGAAAVGIGAVVPVAMSGNSHQSAKAAEAALAPEPAQMPHNASGQLVAWIGDVDDDTVTLMVGDRDVTIHDRDLVTRLAASAF